MNRPDQMISAARRRGLDGLAITDHQTVEGGLVGKKWAKKNTPDFVVVPGIEIRTIRGDILGLGLDENVSDNLSVAETVEKIHGLGGIAIAAHPFAQFIFRRAVQEEARLADAIEVFNASTRLNWRANKKALELAAHAEKPGTASSDAHIARDVGRAGIECNADDIDGILKCVRKGKFETFGKYTPVWDLAYLTTRKFARAAKYRIVRTP